MSRIRRRIMLANAMQGDNMELVFDYTYHTDNIIKPIAYDASTQLFEVESFPASWTYDVGEAHEVAIHLLNVNAFYKLLPCPYARTETKITKQDATHFSLDSAAVSALGDYDCTAFQFEFDRPKLIKLSDKADAIGSTFKLVITHCQSLIDPYCSFGLHGMDSQVDHILGFGYDGASYFQGPRLCDMSLFFSIDANFDVHPGILEKMEGYNQRSNGSQINHFLVKDKQLTVGRDGKFWGYDNDLYTNVALLNGTTIKLYKLN